MDFCEAILKLFKKRKEAYSKDSISMPYQHHFI